MSEARYLFEERAAIYEFDAGMSRKDAEARVRKEMMEEIMKRKIEEERGSDEHI